MQFSFASRFRKSYTSLLLAATMTCVAGAQTAKKPQNPRAIAVVRWQTDANGNATPQLVPVLIRDNGSLFDASVYEANPVPMAADDGVVYQVVHQGAPVGWFTVTGGDHAGGGWMAAGAFKEIKRTREPDIFANRTQSAIQVKPGEKIEAPNPDASVDDRQEENRKTTTVYDENGRPGTGDEKAQPQPQQQPPNPSAKEDPNRPRLSRRPADQAASTQEPSGTPAPVQKDDPDRPRLHRGAPAATGNTSDESSRVPQGNDPNRPRLTRNRNENSQQRENAAGKGSPVPQRVLQAADADNDVNATIELVAISDATNREPRNFKFTATPAELAQRRAKVEAMAMPEVRQWLAAHGAAAPAAKGNKPASLNFNDARFTAVDPSGTNNPVLVYSATLAGEPDVYVIVVAREDIYGQLHKQLARVTDARHLDEFPRLKFIDVVDAEADGRGELLFEESDGRVNDFILYRSTMDTMRELFKGAAYSSAK